MWLPLKIGVLFALNICIAVNGSIEEEQHGVVYANRCEACKILATELEARLEETGRSHDVIDLGYCIKQIIFIQSTTTDERYFFVQK